MPIKVAQDGFRVNITNRLPVRNQLVNLVHLLKIKLTEASVEHTRYVVDSLAVFKAFLSLLEEQVCVLIREYLHSLNHFLSLVQGIGRDRHDAASVCERVRLGQLVDILNRVDLHDWF